MRSLLFVPGDQPKKLARALDAGADALILDLEDSVAPASKQRARQTVLEFLQGHGAAEKRPVLYVRINAPGTGLAEDDLARVVQGAPDGIVLPKSGAGREVAELDRRLAGHEAAAGIPTGATRILAIATETAAAVFALGSYAGSSDRLSGLAWGVEDLAADIGARSMRAEGDWSEPARLVRNLCLMGAVAAGVAAIDSVYTDFRDLDGLRRDCDRAARDGFTAKMAIHPDQVAVINEAFTPGEADIAHAKRVIEAFSQPGAGAVTSLDGSMIDIPHLKAARRLLQRIGPDRP